MRIDVSEREGVAVVALQGEATIDHAGALRDVLIDAVRRSDHIVLDASGITGVHYPVLQTLCSAHRTCAAQAKVLTIGEAPASAFTEAVAAAGLVRHTGCPYDLQNDCLWARAR